MNTPESYGVLTPPLTKTISLISDEEDLESDSSLEKRATGAESSSDEQPQAQRALFQQAMVQPMGTSGTGVKRPREPVEDLPDLAEYFQGFPDITVKNQISMLRAYASYLVSKDPPGLRSRSGHILKKK